MSAFGKADKCAVWRIQRTSSQAASVCGHFHLNTDAQDYLLTHRGTIEVTKRWLFKCLFQIRGDAVYKTLTTLAVAATIAVAAVAVPQQAEARGGALAAGIIGGVAAGAIIGSAANNGYYGPGYYGPAYAYGPQPVYYGYRHYRHYRHCWWRFGHRVCRY